jgi:hypothetical protein
MAKSRRSDAHYVRINIALVGKEEISVYAGKPIRDALFEISRDMNLYHGVRLAQVLAAVYAQGKKDGARSVFDRVDVLKSAISHRNPGQPKKKKLAAKKRKRK